jgi:formate hydrogenlyase subunit 6/NADH:ubiquinone oxidoreductase subunit I
MNIIQVIAENLRSRPVTLRFPERVEPPKDYRGLVGITPELCVGCATCAYVCSSSAIRVDQFSTAYEWRYDPGKCTFCARCVEVCPTHALTMENDRPPVYRESGDLLVMHRLQYPMCPLCGQVAKPVNEAVLARAFDEVSEEIRAWSQLCARCRSQSFQPVRVASSLEKGT